MESERGARRAAYGVKRILDVLLAALLLTLLSPVLAIVAFLLWLTNGGSVFYRQLRLGQGMKPFTLYKFKTMVDGADGQVDKVFHLNHANGPFFKAKGDPRVTRLGGVLRTVFLDEVPQLFNVLKGDMSLVGPRPCLPSEARERVADLAFRFSVPQGLTGPWQVNGYHVLTFDEQLRVEREYVEGWSVGRDLVILAKTLPLVFNRRGI
jgi:lipopolysaccharide/colanic/teichoic acid biosynthesis glycosyltransferase